MPVGLSGANSVIAPAVVQASQLAADEINAAGGILGRQVVLEIADDASSAVGAQKAYDTLVFQKKVDAVIAMETSAARNAALPIINRGKIPTSTARSTKAVPATAGCTSTAGCRSSRSRPSSTTS